MTRRKPSFMSWLEGGSGRRLRGSTLTESGASMFMGATGTSPAKMGELAHRWMSKEKRRTHKRERREGKNHDG